VFVRLLRTLGWEFPYEMNPNFDFLAASLYLHGRDGTWPGWHPKRLGIEMLRERDDALEAPMLTALPVEEHRERRELADAKLWYAIEVVSYTEAIERFPRACGILVPLVAEKAIHVGGQSGRT
jgi:hypothetical protein